MSRYVTVEETVWPVDCCEPDDDSVQWKLRYAPQHLTPGDFMLAASILSAYGSLTDPHLTMREAEKMLRRARTARREGQ